MFPSHSVLPCTPLGSVTLQKMEGHSTNTPSLAECCWVCTARVERLSLCPEETCRRHHGWKVRKLLCPWLRILAVLKQDETLPGSTALQWRVQKENPRSWMGKVITEMVLLQPSNPPQQRVSNSLFPEEWKSLSLYSS